MRQAKLQWMVLAAVSAAGAWAQVTPNCTPATLPTYVGSPVSVTCSPTGGIGLYTWSVSAGQLPPSLTQSSSTGAITGTLADPAGAYSFTVTATDSLNNTGTQQYSGTTADPVTCAPATGPVEVGVVYTATCTAVFGVSPYAWSIGQTGTVPPGLTITSSGAATGAINYTPPGGSAGAYQYHVLATDSSSPGVTRGATISGTIAGPVVITTTSPLPAATVGNSYSIQFAAGSGVAPYTWVPPSLTGTGLSMTAGGLLSGTPSTTGPLNLTVGVVDSVGGQSNGQFSLTVNGALAITTSSPLPAATVGMAYSTTLSASGGSGSGYTWSITSGALPAGLTLGSKTGVISGTPGSAATTANIGVTVTDSANNTGSGPFVLPVTLQVTTATLPVATIGSAYNQTLAAVGGAGQPYTWSIASGTLPAGLTLNGSGTISGTPSTAALNGSFTIKATDSAKASGTAALTLPVTLVLATTSPLPAATANAPYSQTFAAEGGAGGYTWSETGSLPAGLTLSSTGVLGGTPTTPGAPVTFNVTVTDSSGTSLPAAPFTLAVMSIATSSLGSGVVNVSYNQTLSGAGGVPPYTWSVSAGLLPAGLTLSPGGVVSGTPQMAGTSTLTIQLLDSAANAIAKKFAITIQGPLVVTTSSLPNATVGIGYSQTLAAAGGAPPYTWAITTGSLPSGLSLAASGTISGTVGATGQSTFTVTVTDTATNTAQQQLTLTVVNPPSITTVSLPNGPVGVSYSQALAATNGTPPYKWSISSGGLPAGLTLSAAGTISGTPSAVGTSNFTVELTDATGVTATQPLSIKVISTLAISTASPLPMGEAGLGYSQQLSASGGAQPYTWSLVSGALPQGLTLAAGGAISGTPAANGQFSFNVQVTDSNKVSAPASLTLTIVAQLSITTPSGLSGGAINAAYSQSLTATGGVTPYVWTLTSGALPVGLKLSNGGTISGTPTATGIFTFTLRVEDALNATSSRQFTIDVASGLTITTAATLPAATVQALYTETLSASGGATPYSWAVTGGDLPLGLALSPGGVISGIPTAAGPASFTVTVTDAQARQAFAQFSMTVVPALVVTTSSLRGGSVGVSYSQAVGASGGTPPYSWSIINGALPGGLSLAAGGMISGTPGAAGTFDFTAKVTDSNSVSATQKLSITITAGLTITTAAALPNAPLNGAYQETLTAAGGIAPYLWAVSNSTLPAGLTLSTGGVISGTATVGGKYTFTVTVTDSTLATATQEFMLTVGNGLTFVTTALPTATAEAAYNQTVNVTGGTPPYTFSISSGGLPPGLTLSGATVSGTPSQSGSYKFGIQVTDSASNTATQQFTIVVGGPLPSAAVGTAYSQTLNAAGTAPYTWTVSQGSLPSGLSISSSGVISGTPSTAGNYSFSVQVADSTGATATLALNLTVLAANYGGITATSTSAQQLSGTLTLGAGYPADITGQITLAFTPDPSLTNPVQDPAIQFSGGGTTQDFTIPANSTAPFSFSLQTGTVAGTITLSVNWQSGGTPLAVPAALTQTIQVDKAAPAISSVSVSTSGSGFTVTVVGYSNTREVASAQFQFTPASGQTLQTTSLTVPLSSAAASWFSGSGSDQYGGQFTLTLPFDVSNGSASAIGSVSVTLVNSVGNSNSASANF